MPKPCTSFVTMCCEIIRQTAHSVEGRELKSKQDFDYVRCVAHVQKIYQINFMLSMRDRQHKTRNQLTILYIHTYTVVVNGYLT